MRKKVSLMAVLLVAVAAPLGAQTAPATPAEQTTPGATTPASVNNPNPGANPGQADAEQEQTTSSPDTQRAEVPLTLDMNAGSLDFSQEATRQNYLGAGLNVGASYDNNLLFTKAPTIGGFVYTVLPNFTLRIGRRRLSWAFNYSGGYLIDQKIRAADSSLHNVNFSLQYRLSPHVSLSLVDNFSRIPQLANQFPGGTTTNGVGAIQQPNQSVIIGALAVQQQNTGSAEVTYQYSASDLVGAGATSYMTRFGKPSGVTSSDVLFNAQSYEGNGFYNHRMTTRNWLGVTYSYQRYSFSPGNETVDGDSILALYTFYLQPKMQLAFFAGPEYSSLNTVIITTVGTPPTVTTTSTPISDKHWSVSGGGSFSWQGKRTSVTASVSRKISDGGGLLGAVELLSGSVGLRRDVIRGGTLALNAVYGNSDSLARATGAFAKLNSATANLEWTQKLTRGLVASFGYTQEYQHENTQLPPATVLHHSRGWATLGYSWGRSLGR